MAGKKENLRKMWDTLGKKLDLEPPTSMDGNVYLGCGQEEFTPSEAEAQKVRDHFRKLFDGTGRPVAESESCHQEAGRTQSASSSPPKIKKIKGYRYTMCGHAEQCVERYLELSGKDVSTLKKVPTPCIDDHL